MFQKILIVILVVGFLLRLVGLKFGLPLWVVGDEAALVFGALKMLELHTLLPALHEAEFLSVLYYPPYLSYIYLPFFVGIIGIKWLVFSDSFSNFIWLLKSDVTGFFLVGRFLSVTTSTLTIWVVYKTGLNIFKKNHIALSAALCLALAFLPVNYAHWARHWTVMSLIFALIIYILSKPDWSVAKRYLVVVGVAGVSVGLNLQVSFALFFVLLWTYWVEQISFKALVRARWFWQAAVIFAGGTLIAYLLWPPGFWFLKLLIEPLPTASGGRSLLGFGLGYWSYLESFIKAEPILLGLIIVGTWDLRRKQPGLVKTIWAFMVFYIAVFYWVFSTMDRFILVLYPFLVLLAGYGLVFIYEKVKEKSVKWALGLVGLIVLGLLLPVLRLDYLLQKNDTRMQAVEWLEQNISDQETVAVLVPLMRLPSTGEAVKSLTAIDPAALRTIDHAEKNLPLNLRTNKVFNALNLSTANPELLKDLQKLLIKYQIKYLVVNKEIVIDIVPTFSPSEWGEIVYEIPGSIKTPNQDTISGHQVIPDGFGDGWFDLFKVKNFGPDIVVIKLKQN